MNIHVAVRAGNQFIRGAVFHDVKQPRMEAIANVLTTYPLGDVDSIFIECKDTVIIKS